MTQDITALRAALFAQMAELRAADTSDKDKLQAALGKAAAVSDLAKTITDTARVENEYLKLSGGGQSTFLGGAVDQAQEKLPPGITGVRRHLLAG